MGAFHAYDIRGIYGEDFNREDAYKTGFFLPGLLGTDKILVGRDARLSSPEIFSYLSEGITDAGAQVCNAGRSTTPMIYWATAKYGFDASVMITASHNPGEYNGMKVSQKGALPVGYENGLNVIESMINSKDPVHPFREKGEVVDYPIRDAYLAFLKPYVKRNPKMKVAIDCSNGMAGLLVKDLLGNGPLYLNEIPDGRFPNHDPNPLDPVNIRQLQKTVIKEKCDLGVIFDGDADRVMFVDEKGNFVPPDLIIAVLGHHFLKGPADDRRVLQDIRTSKSVEQYLEKFGARMHTWKVGRAFATPKLKSINGIYGGEFAGHYYFRDFYYSDSGILAALIVLEIAEEFFGKEKPFSTLIDAIKSFENSGEINFRVRDKEAAMEEVRQYYESAEHPETRYDFDGYRIEFKNWWFNLRPSNTEPYLRLVVEANTPALLAEKVSELGIMIKKFE